MRSKDVKKRRRDSVKRQYEKRADATALREAWHEEMEKGQEGKAYRNGMKRGSKEANVGRDGVKGWRDVTACAGSETELRGGMRTQWAQKA